MEFIQYVIAYSFLLGQLLLLLYVSCCFFSTFAADASVDQILLFQKVKSFSFSRLAKYCFFSRLAAVSSVGLLLILSCLAASSEGQLLLLQQASYSFFSKLASAFKLGQIPSLSYCFFIKYVSCCLCSRLSAATSKLL